MTEQSPDWPHDEEIAEIDPELWQEIHDAAVDAHDDESDDDEAAS